MLFLSQPLKLKLRINKKAAKVLISNYWSLNSGVFMNYFATRGDNLIVGRFIGTEALGFYGRAFNIAKMPTNLFGSTMDKVLFPILASNDVSDENRKKSFLLLSFIISLFGLTLSLLLTTFSAQIVSIILGPQWIGVSGLLGILGFATFFRLAYKISISQLLVQRKFRMLSNMQITITIIMLILCYLGTYLGVEYVAGATTLAIILQYTYLNIIACKEIGVNLKEFIEAHRLPLLFTTCSTIIIGLMHYWVPDVLSSNYFFFAYSIALFVLIGLILFAIPSSNEYTNWWRQKISEFLFKKKKRKNN
jgi:PST family polysaccharide transporter